MRNAILVAVGVFFVVIGGAMAALWYIQASSTKEAVEGLIAQINAEEPLFTYDAIETSGFPATMTLSIVNPRFSGRVDSLLANHFPDLPEWEENIRMEGTIAISVNVLSNRYSVRFPQKFYSEPKIGGVSASVYDESSAPMECTVEVDAGSFLSGQLWSFSTLADTQNAENLDMIRSLDCLVAAERMTDTKTTETLYTSGGGRVYITNTPTDTQREVRLYTHFAEFNVTEAGDRFYSLYGRLFSPKHPVVFDYSALGTQKMDLDMFYKGPRNIEDLTLDTPFEIGVTNLAMESNISKSSLTLSVANALDENNRSAHANLKQEMEFKEGYDEYARGQIKQQVKALQDSPEVQMLPSLASSAGKYSTDELYEIISPAIPSFQSWGKLTQAFELNYKGDTQFSQGDVSMPAFDLSIAPYGLTGSGAGTLASDKPLPTGQASFTCTNCMRFIDDVAEYIGRLNTALTTLSPDDDITVKVQPQHIDGMKHFLTELASYNESDMNSGLYRFDIVSDGMSDIRVNGRPFIEVMGLYQKHLLPASTAQEESHNGITQDEESGEVFMDAEPKAD